MATVATNPQVARGPLNLKWSDVAYEAVRLIRRNTKPDALFGVPTGGSLVALDLSHRWGAPLLAQFESARGVLVVDDLVDSGMTLGAYRAAGATVDALYRKPGSPKDLAPHAAEWDGWIKFPWEHESRPEDAVTRLLQYIGEDPTRDGLANTPGRVCRALAEMTAGYKQDAAAILGTAFDVAFDEMVVLRGIRFHSLCEHHIMPFSGTIDVAYVPNGKVLGISKLPRMVHCFARRLQVQERLTEQIASAVMEHAKAKGVGVIVRAKHACMGCRGVQQPDADMVTSVVRGAMMDDPRARAEFLSLCKA